MHNVTLIFSIFTIIWFALLAMPAQMQDSFYNEAPILSERVAAGELLHIDERLPLNPLLITPRQNVGVYGGTWHMAMLGVDDVHILRTIGYEHLVVWNSAWTEVSPDIAQSYEVSEDARLFTFTLREGMRWSDGTLFTADDLVFWYEAIFLKDELTSIGQSWLGISKDELVVEKMNDTTVVFRFSEPQGLFLQKIASAGRNSPTRFPRHYLSQFHPDYHAEAESLAVAAGAGDWVELFITKQMVMNPDLPTLNAWVLEADTYFADSKPGSLIAAARNPYYWKIDTDFNQLPYIDRVVFHLVSSSDEVLALAVDGQINMQDRNIPAEAFLPENQAQGGYSTYRLIPNFSNYMVVALNLTHADPVKHSIFQNKDFRIGLSYAINRPAIIEAMGIDVELRQVAPLDGTPFYNEQMAMQYTDYNVAMANDYLDRAGYAQRDASGWRLGPDNDPIRFTMLIPSPVPYGARDIHLAQIKADWAAVGIDIAFEEISRSDAEIRWAENNFDATIWIGDGGFDAILTPRYYVPVEFPWAQQSPRWTRWYLDPADPLGEMPPAVIQRAMYLYRQILSTGNMDQQIEWMKQIIAIAAEEFMVIGIHAMPEFYGILQPSFRNVPEFMYLASSYPNPGPTNPSQYYIDPQN